MGLFTIGLLAVLALATPGPVGASSALAVVDARLKGCLAQDGSNVGVQVCDERAFAAADRILNRTYADWVDALKHPAAGDAKDDAEILKRLISAERAWIAFRDVNCSLVSVSMLGGTGEGDGYGQCRYDMTKSRVNELQAVKASR